MSYETSVIYPNNAPDAYAGLVYWYEADKAALTVGGNKKIPLLPELFQGKDVSQAAEANQPTLIPGGCNGHAVTFQDGSIATAALVNSTTAVDFGDTYTVMAVCSLPVGAPTANCIVEVSLAGGADTGFLLYLGNNANPLWRCVDSLGNKDVALVRDMRDNKYHTYTGINTGTQTFLFIDGILVGGPTAYTAPNPSVLNRITLGNRPTANAVFGGSIAFVAAYNVALSTQNHLDIANRYCRSRFFNTVS